MPNSLDHSPARIVRQLLIDLGLAVAGSYDSSNRYTGGAWPVTATSEVDAPDNAITVYDTAGRGDGRSMIDGETFSHYGFQVRVRAADHDTGWAKADSIENGLSKSVYQRTVHVGGSTYLVHCVSGIGDVLSIGKETPASTRRVFTLNALLSVKKV